MIDFDSFIIMKQGFLDKLNNSIDKVIKEKSEMNLDYNLLEKALGLMIRNKTEKRTSALEPIIPIKKEEMLKVTLEFFKSVDEEFYERAVNIILQQHNNIKMNIYNLHKIENFDKENESDLPEYTRGGSVYTHKGKSIIHIPMKSELDSKEEQIIGNNTGTLDDLYILVHEIAHMFDLNIESTNPDKEDLEGKNSELKVDITRELLGESTAIAFERLLTEYLLKETTYSPEAVKKIWIQRENSSLNDAKLVYAKLMLAKEKEEKGEIKNSYIEDFMLKNNFSVQFIRRMARRIIDDPRSMQFEKRYAIAGLVAPTIIKKYKEVGAETIKEYLAEAKAHKFNSAMNMLGIELNEEGLNNLIKNMKEQEIILEEGR